MISKRRISRLIGIQAYYLEYFCDHQRYDLIENIISLQDLSYLKKYDEDLLTTLIHNSIKKEIEYTGIIEKFLSQDWTIDRIDKLKLSILRNAICELNFYPDTDKGIIIHEYVTISRFFMSEKDTNFINGILEKIANHINTKK
jgi:transcription antitermination factor NusB